MAQLLAHRHGFQSKFKLALSRHGPIQKYVLADLYSWLESHSGLTHLPTFMPSSSYPSSSTNSTSK
ncbi:MAG: hypothetical protein ACJ71E_09710 [Nitrososphaeraceae archaeon]